MFLYGFAGASPLPGMFSHPTQNCSWLLPFCRPGLILNGAPLKRLRLQLFPRTSSMTQFYLKALRTESTGQRFSKWQNGPATRSPVPKDEGVKKGNETSADKENKDEKTKAVSFPLLKQPCCPCPLPSPHSDYPISLPELEVTGHSGGAEQKTLRYPERLRRADPLPAENCFKRTACFWHYRPRWRPSPKPTGLARRAEIWCFAKLLCPKAGLLEKAASPKLVSTLEYLAQENVYSHASGKLVCKTKAEPGPKKQAPFARVEMKFDRLLHKVAFKKSFAAAVTRL